MKKTKKALWISLISFDVIITIFLFVVSIIMLATMPSKEALTLMKQSSTYQPKGFIEYLQIHSTLYLLVGVIPLVLLLIINIIVLFVYVKKTSEKKKVALNELTEEQMEALRKELLKDLANQNSNEK